MLNEIKFALNLIPFDSDKQIHKVHCLETVFNNVSTYENRHN